MALRMCGMMIGLLATWNVRTSLGLTRTITHVCQEGWTTLDVGIDANILQSRGIIFCVKSFHTAVTWARAQAQCQQSGGFLLILDPDWFGVPIEVASENIRQFAADQSLSDLWTSARVVNEYLWWMADMPKPVDSPAFSTWLWAEGQPDVDDGMCGQFTTSTQDTVSVTDEAIRFTPFYMKLSNCQDTLPFMCINKGIDYQARTVPQCDSGWLGSIYTDTCATYDPNVTASYEGAKRDCEGHGGHLSVPLTDSLNNLTASVVRLSVAAESTGDQRLVDRYECFSCDSTMMFVDCFSRTESCDNENVCETVQLVTPRGTYYSMGCVRMCGSQQDTYVKQCRVDEECQLSSTCCQGHMCKSHQVAAVQPESRRRRDADLGPVPGVNIVPWLGGELSTSGIQWVDGSTTPVSSSRLHPSYESVDEGCLALDIQQPLNEEWLVLSDCITPQPYVCQKPATPGSYHIQITTHPEHIWAKVADITVNIRGNIHPTLACQVRNYHPTLEVIWIKDGHYISNGLPPSGLSLAVNYDLAGKLPPGPDFTLAMLQGSYSCMVWGFDPLEYEVSKSALVRFHDVSTFQVLIKLRGATFDPEFARRRLQHIWPREEDNIYFPPIKDLFEISNLELYPNVFINGYSEGSLVVNATVLFTLHNESLGVLWPLTGNSEPMTAYSAEFVSQQLEGVVLVQMTRSMNLKVTGNDWYYAYNVTANDVVVRGTAHCPEREVLTGDAVYTIPSTSIGALGSSTQVCYSDGVPMATCHCYGEFTSGAHWAESEVYQNCTEPLASAVTKVLQNLTQQVVTPDNVLEVAQEVALATFDASILQPIDVILASHIIENIVGVRDLGEEVGHVLARSISSIMEVLHSVLIESQNNDKANTRILQSLDTFASSCNSNGVFIVESRVALKILAVNDFSTSGLLILSGVDDLFSEEQVLALPNGSDTVIRNVSAAIHLPDELLSIAQQAQVKWQTLLDQTTNPELRALIEANPVRLSFMAFQDGSLFLSPSQLDPDRVVVVEANGVVVSASLHGYGVSAIRLSEPISTTFYPAHNTREEDICVFWDFAANGGLGNWSRDGCWLADVRDNRVTCSCNHLTNFAILTDIDRGRLSQADALALSLITYVGLALSIAGLSFTVLSFLLFKNLRKGRSHKTLLNLALALLCVYVIFLVGINQTSNKAGCMAVAALLTYFLLAAFAWMLVEGVLQYLLFFKVFDTYVENFMWKTAVPAWCLPAVPVVATAAYDYTLFHGHEQYCWLHKDPFIYGFLIPVCCVIVINTVLYVIVIRSLTCGRSTIRSSQSNPKAKMIQFRASITCFVVLGLTWIFGILAVADARLPFQYLFCIFNSIQGFLIFVFHVIRERSVRESWWSCCCPGDISHKTYSSGASETQGTKSTGLTSVHKPSLQLDKIQLNPKK